MIIIGIIFVIWMYFVAHSLFNIKVNIQCNAHNTAKMCDYLFDISNKLDKIIEHK